MGGGIHIKRKEIKRTNLTEQVSAAIKDYITNKEWLPSSKIPSENELADLFGVNRLTVRMALQKLNTVGIVETKAGEGTFVKEFDFREYISEISDLLISPEMIDDVLAFRTTLEIEAIRLAVEKANDEVIVILEQAYVDLENAAIELFATDSHNFDKVIATDIEFHYQICKASGNAMFPIVFNAVIEFVLQYMQSIQKQRFNNGIETYMAGIHSHKEIINSIKTRDFELCKRAYLRTIDYKIAP